MNKLRLIFRMNVEDVECTFGIMIFYTILCCAPVRLSWCNLWYTIAESLDDILAKSLASLEPLCPICTPPAAEASHEPIHNLCRTWRTVCHIKPQATSSLEMGSGRLRARRQISKFRTAEIVSPWQMRFNNIPTHKFEHINHAPITVHNSYKVTTVSLTWF